MFDLALIFSTFIIVFCAELGDKTQLVAFSMTSTTRHPLLIFIAASLALSLSSVLAALLGCVTANLIPSFTGFIAALLFLGFGFYILFSKEAPKIKECFLNFLTLENSLVRILPKFLKQIGSYDYQAVDIMRQERSHGEVFKVLLKEKKLFTDDINDSKDFHVYLQLPGLDSRILKLAPAKALEQIIAAEEAGLAVCRFIQEHLNKEAHHDEKGLEELLNSMIVEETAHLRFFRGLLEKVNQNG